MNTLELRTAVMPNNMTAETFDPWHCVYLEFKGKNQWQVTDIEKRRLHSVVHEWTEAQLPHLYNFKTRGEALAAARRHLYTGHVGGKLWTDGEATAEHLLHDIHNHLTALSPGGNQPRPNEVVDGHRREMEQYIRERCECDKTIIPFRAYPEEFSGISILTIPTIDRYMKNINRDMAALRALNYPMGKLDELWDTLTIDLNAEGYRYTTMTRHIKRCLPSEYMEESKVSTIAGLMTAEQAYLLLEAYEEGIAADHIAGLSAEFNRENLDALRDLIDAVPDEYLRAAYKTDALSGQVRD